MAPKGLGSSGLIWLWSFSKSRAELMLGVLRSYLIRIGAPSPTARAWSLVT